MAERITVILEREWRAIEYPSPSLRVAYKVETKASCEELKKDGTPFKKPRKYRPLICRGLSKREADHIAFVHNLWIAETKEAMHRAIEDIVDEKLLEVRKEILATLSLKLRSNHG